MVFRSIGNVEHVYVYHHPQHATCSSTFFITNTPVHEQSLSLHECRSHLHHDNIQPYFLSNTHLLVYFKDALSEGRQVQAQTELEAILEGGDSTGIPFVCPQFMRPNNWDENIWIERLVKGLEETFPDLKATFSAKLCFSKDILRLCAGFIPNHV